MATLSTNSDPVQLTQQWLQQVVIGLGLCPFAAQPVLENRVRIHVSSCETEVDLLAALHTEIDLLETQPASALETTLLVVPNMLTDFMDYNQFLDQADDLIAQFGWQGEYQIASFHPQYCFADTPPTAAENLTNRSPFPTFHLIREASLTEALAKFTKPEEIPERNIQKINALSKQEIRQLFPWLFSHSL